MKKKNYLFIFLILLSLLIVSCKQDNSNTDIDPDGKPVIDVEASDKELIINKIFYTNGNFTQYEYVDDWAKMIDEEYGILVQVDFTSLDFMYFNDYYIQNRSDFNMTGIVYIPEWSGIIDLVELIDYNAIIPMTDYLVDNETWQSLPSEYKSIYDLGDDEVWAMAGDYRYNEYLVRIVKEAWLTALGLNVPSNYMELYEIAQAFKHDDPDGNGKDDTYGLAVYNDYSFLGVEDLFNAKGVFLDNGDYPINYNPFTNTFEDVMLYDDTEEVLLYIRQLVDEELIDSTGYIGTTIGAIKDSSGSICEKAYWALPGQALTTIKESESLAKTKIEFGSTAYVLLENTVNPKEMVDSFVNVFLKDYDAHLALRFGIKDTTYSVEGQNIIQYEEYKDNDDLLPRITVELQNPNVLDPADVLPLNLTSMTPVFYESPYYVFYNEYDDFTAEYQEKAVVETKTYYENNINDFYTVPIDIRVEERYVSATNQLFGDVAQNIYTSELSVEDIMKQYEADSKALGLMSKIDDMNEKIGEVTQYGYH